MISCITHRIRARPMLQPLRQKQLLCFYRLAVDNMQTVVPSDIFSGLREAPLLDLTMTMFRQSQSLMWLEQPFQNKRYDGLLRGMSSKE